MRMLFAFFVWWKLYTMIETALAPFGIAQYAAMPIWIIVVAFTIPYFTVSVPEVCGLVTIDLFKSLIRPLVPSWTDNPLYNLRVYATGIHFRFPWEQVKTGNYINLRLRTMSFEGETYPSQDGPLMKVDWSFQFHPRLEMLSRYFYIGISTIVEGLHDVGSAFLSREIKKKSPEEVRNGQEALERELREHFEKSTHRVDNIHLARILREMAGKSESEDYIPMEMFYGIDIAKTSIADLDYSEKYQRVLETKAVADKLQEIAADMEKGTLTEEGALEAAMVINGDVTKNVQENIQNVKGEGMHAVASFLLALTNAAGGRGGSS